MFNRRRDRRGDTPSIPGYRDLRPIGRGGFGTVYAAHQVAFGRDVAVKVVEVDLTPAAIRRFRQEPATAGRLDGHPHVIRVYETGDTRDGRPYVTMELHPQGSLADRLQREGPLPLAEVLDVGVKLAGALDAAHGRDIVHRDVKPQNVLVSPFVGPVLADFGIAAFDDADVDTRPGGVFSVAHVAPEVLDGRRATPAADLYSLASTLYELLAGRAPYSDEVDNGLLGVLRRAATGAVPPIGRDDVPAEVEEELIARLLARDPAHRPASARALAERLQGMQEAAGLEPTPLVEGPPPAAGGSGDETTDWTASPGDDRSPADGRARADRRAPATVAAALAVAAVVVAAAVGGWSQWRGQTAASSGPRDETATDDAEGDGEGDRDDADDAATASSATASSTSTTGPAATDDGRAAGDAPSPTSPPTRPDGTVTVPPAGDREATACDPIRAAGLACRLVARRATEPTHPTGVLAQTPAAGTDVAPGATVTVTHDDHGWDLVRRVKTPGTGLRTNLSIDSGAAPGWDRVDLGLIFVEQAPGTQPLYCWRSDGTGDQVTRRYTLGAGEPAGFHACPEGDDLLGYVPEAPSPATVQVYVFANGTFHLYSTDPQDPVGRSLYGTTARPAFLLYRQP